MSDDFATIKAALNLRTVITSQTGFSINSSGHLSECPFCGGKDCFSLPKDRDGYRCFQCDKTGDLFTFLEDFHHIDKAAALKMAAGLANIPLEEKKARAVKLSVTDKIRLAAADYYHGQLAQGQAYFDKRGHLPAVLQREKVGFSDGHLLDHLRSAGFLDKEIIESGMAKEKEIEGKSRLLDFFGKGLAIFPHYATGRVLTFTMKDAREVERAQKLTYQMPNEQRDKKWLFYGQDALDKFDEVILVEGENDRLQVLNAGVGGVMAMIGQISDIQIKGLASRGRGKVLFLWTDNDKGGRDYIRKIALALPELAVKVIAYGVEGDDPDSYLRAFEGDKRREVRRLQLAALDYLTWEIGQAALLPNLEERLKHLQKAGGNDKANVFRLIGMQPAIQQDIFREKLEKLGFSEKAIGQQLDFSQDLLRQIQEYFQLLDNPKDADPIQIGELCFKFFAHHGRFYFDSEDRVWLIYQDRTYEVGNNTPFNALMLKTTRMDIAKAPANMVWSALKHTAYLNGRKIERCRWIHTDVVKDTIYLNLNGAGNKILKISPTRVEEIPNGMNDDHVLLSASSKIHPMTWLPDVEVQEGMTLLKELVFDNLTVKKEQKYLILCWLISGFCPDMAPYQFLMKFGGYASSGKSTASKLLTALVYGSEDLTDCSAAAAFSSAAKNPMVVIDNLENKDLNRGLQKFLLLAATRGSKEKRKGGSDTDTVDESPRALINVTAIEPFTLSELISRTVEIQFDRRIYGSDDFHESDVLEKLKKHRDLILSALIRFIQVEVLNNLEMRKEYMSILNRQYKGHAKDRTNAYLALLMLILTRLLKYVPFYGHDDVMFGLETGEPDIYRAWIEEQNAAAKETEIGSNSILQLFGGLMREYLQWAKGKTLIEEHVAGFENPVFIIDPQEYGLTVYKARPELYCGTCGLPAGNCAGDCKCGGERYNRSIMEFTATSAEIVDALDRYAKLTGKRNPYESAAIFGARLRNDMSLLKKDGWEVVTTEGQEPYFKKIQGKRFLKFRYTVVR